MSLALDFGDFANATPFAVVLLFVVVFLGLAFLHKVTGEPLPRVAESVARVIEAIRGRQALPGGGAIEPPPEIPPPQSQPDDELVG